MDPKPVTVADVFDYCLPDAWRADDGSLPAFLEWPPDAFAVFAACLFQSGAYVRVVKEWPPRFDAEASTSQRWLDHIKAVARAWRAYAVDPAADGARPPPAVQKWWEFLLEHRDAPLSECHQRAEVCDTLLQLVSAADEASAGAGIPPRDADQWDDFLIEVQLQLLKTHNLDQTPADKERSDPPTTLCRHIHPSRLIVLPKMRTPESGITVRSLTHHLALISPCGVKPVWQQAALPHRRTRAGAATGIDAGPAKNKEANLLLIPWPKRMRPGQFSEVQSGAVGMLVGHHKFFAYTPDPLTKDDFRELREIYLEAIRQAKVIDGVIFPEMSMTPEEFAKAQNVLIDAGHVVGFVVAGLYRPAAGSEPADNYAMIVIKGLHGSLPHAYHKHHRWFLERGQIGRYGLGKSLDPQFKWWEFASLRSRSLQFIALHDWLAFTVLICEDLARPDPAGEIIRAVGPNLVIAILQDGPQFKSRWSARSAAPLADDPGSAVLTLTSIGMIGLCAEVAVANPPADPPKGWRDPGQRVVAMWRDRTSPEPIEIELDADANAIVLKLENRYEEQFTADGRSDDKMTGHLVLKGTAENGVIQLRGTPRPAGKIKAPKTRNKT